MPNTRTGKGHRVTTGHPCHNQVLLKRKVGVERFTKSTICVVCFFLTFFNTVEISIKYKD